LRGVELVLTEREVVNRLQKIFCEEGCCSDHDGTFLELL